MSKNKRCDSKNNYQHFKATIGAISEEVDYFGNCKEVLSLNKVHLNTKKNNPIADYALINKNKATETLFDIAHKGPTNQIVSFYGKIMDCRQVQLYDGLKFLQSESHCKIGYIKNLNIHRKKIK
jgi:hypothetical protein